MGYTERSIESNGIVPFDQPYTQTGRNEVFDLLLLFFGNVFPFDDFGDMLSDSSVRT